MNKYWQVGEEHPDWIQYLIEDKLLEEMNKDWYIFKQNNPGASNYITLTHGDMLVFTTEGHIGIIYSWWNEHKVPNNE